MCVCVEVFTLFSSAMRLLASESTCRDARLSKFSILLIRLLARLRSRRFTSCSRPAMVSMLLKERSSHCSCCKLSRPEISSSMLLSSCSLVRLVNCHKFSIRRTSAYLYVNADPLILDGYQMYFGNPV